MRCQNLLRGRQKIVLAFGLAVHCLFGVAAGAAQSAAQSTDDANTVMLLDGAPSEELYDISLFDLMDMDVDVVTTSKRAQSISDAPAMVYVITEKNIRERGYVNLSDVFRDVPGMDPSFNYFSEMGTLVSVRGTSGNNKLVLLVNGVRINPPGGEEAMLRSDISVRHAKQIEISYGPGSTLYGQDAIFGVVNIITKQPEGFSAVGQAAFGSQAYKDGYVSLGAVLGAEDNPVRLTAFAQLIDSDLTDLSNQFEGWWQTTFASGDARGGNPPQRWDRGFNGFLRVEQGDSSVQLWYRDSSRSSAEGGYGGILYFVDESIWHDRSLVIEGKNSFELSDMVTLESAITYNKYEVDADSRYVFPASDTELFLDDYKFARGTGIWLEERLTIDVTDELNVTVGAVGMHFDISPKATIPGGANRIEDLSAQGGAFEYYTEIGNADSKVEIPRATNVVYQNYGAYAEGQWQPVETLRLIGGVRLDHNTRFDTTPISPRVSVIYDFNDRITAKYIFTQAFVAPAPYSAYNAYDSGTDLNTLNPSLEPEQARSNEINVTYTADRFMVGLSLFYNQQKNLISLGDRGLAENVIAEEVYLDVAGTETRRLVHTINRGETTTVGGDLYARADYAVISPWASVSLVDSETIINGASTGLDQLSALNARLGTAIRPVEGLVITPSMTLRSNIQFAGDTEESLTAGYDSGVVKMPFTLNLHASYEPLAQLRFFVTGSNLTNGKNVAKGVINSAPQPGIRVFGGVRYEY